jgi:tetratricopeptide (TPR) repeat protein
MRVPLSQCMALLIRLMLGLAVVVPLPLVFTTTVVAQVTSNDHKMKAEQFQDQAIQQHLSGQLQAALQSFQQALELYRAIHDRINEGSVLNGLGIVYRDLGQNLQALNYFQQALTVAQSVNNQVDRGQFLNNIGEIHYRLGQCSRAIEYYQQAIAAAEAINDQVGEYLTLSNLSLVYRDLGQYPQAMNYTQRSLATARSVSGQADEELVLRKLASEFAVTCSSSPYLFYSTTSSPDHRQLISIASKFSPETGLFDYQVKQWNLATGKGTPLSFAIPPSLSNSSQGFTKYYFLNSVAFAPNGKTLVGAYYDNIYSDVIVKSWQLETGTEARTLQIHLDASGTQTGDVQLSSDGNTLIRYGRDFFGLTRITLWDLVSNRLIRSVQFPGVVNNATISLDNQTIAIQAIDHTIQVQNLLNGETIQTLRSDTENQLALSSNGKTLFVSDRNGLIKIIDTATGQLIQTISAFPNMPHAPFLALSTDNSTLFASDANRGQIQQWNIVTGKRVRVFCCNAY